MDRVRRKVVLGGTAALSLSSSKVFGGLPDPFGYTIIPDIPPLTDATGRTLASATIDPTKRNFIGLIEGQSLAGDHILHSYTVQNPTKIHNVNWAGDRLLYQHQEPMLGTSFYDTRTYISFWGKLGDLLIARGFDRVIWGNTSVAGASSAQLAPDGILGHRIPVFFNVLRSLGIAGNQVSAIISMQGEADASNNVTGAVYKANRRDLARSARSFGFAGLWFVPQETFNGKYLATSPAIRQAQAELAAEAGFAAGPDFDALGLDYRDATKVHLNGPLGHDTAAQMWADSIAARFLT